MVTTSTYGWNPSAADVVLNAFAMCGVQRAQITTEHLENAAYQANLVGVDFTNRNPNMWAIGESSFPLVAGTATYNFDPQVVAVSAVWLDQTQPDGSFISRVLSPLSATDYAQLAAKEQRGTPSTYYFRLASPIPTITLWLVPNAAPAYIMRVQTFRQQQDTTLPGGLTVDAPYRFLDAYTFGLAARLAVIYKPEAAQALKQQYLEAFTLAAQLDQQRVPLRLGPVVSGYYPR